MKNSLDSQFQNISKDLSGTNDYTCLSAFLQKKILNEDFCTKIEIFIYNRKINENIF